MDGTGVVVLLVVLAVLAIVVLHRIAQGRRLRRAERTFNVAELTDMGWRIEAETDREVVIVRSHRVNHVLHLLLSIFTLGLWLIVWLSLVLVGGEKRRSFVKPKTPHSAT